MPTRVGLLFGSEKHFPNEHSILPGDQGGHAIDDTVDGTVPWMETVTDNGGCGGKVDVNRYIHRQKEDENWG